METSPNLIIHHLFYSEFFGILVGEKFLKNLPSPLELNEIRTLKPEKYAQMRKILTNFTGSPVLKLIKDNQEELDLDPDVFDLVYEGFWDLYTLQPKVKDVSNKKLQ